MKKSLLHERAVRDCLMYNGGVSMEPLEGIEPPTN